MIVYPNNDIVIYPAICLPIYPTKQVSSDHHQKQGISRKEWWKDSRKDRPSAVSSPKVNLCRPEGSKFIFLQCKKPFPHAPQREERRMLPMVAVHKLGEVRQ
ncbi:hypothetical protein [Sphingobacterium hotanense]|uniref:hypothetical protein n=1 Tax=Sphingobacterium hotanense TaxID=649196 RepID=UPI0021A6C4EF|nr:hypothetical protein [Sphingobacterium hotanense]MCT1526439.1 hypothetical protein [Sphingobacterium hotanense]